MTAHLRWGILGPGSIARTTARDLQLASIPIVAVGSRSPERAQAFADELSIPRAHASYEELVADDEVDVVYVATTNDGHHPHALLALEAGKHVLLEKPLTLNAAQARELAAAAERADRVLLEAMWTRYLPPMAMLRDVIARGEIGEIRTVIADHTQLLTDRERLRDPARGGGALLDLGIYPVAFAWDLLGAPSACVARGTLTETGVDEQVSILLSYESGAQALLSAGLASPGSTRASIHGTKGRIELDRDWYEGTGWTVFDAEGSPFGTCSAEREGRGMQFQALELERMVAVGERSNSVQPLAESVAIMGLLDEIRAQVGVRYPGEPRA